MDEEGIRTHGYGHELLNFVDRIRESLPPEPIVEIEEEDVFHRYEVEEEDLEIDVDGTNERLSKHERNAIQKGNNNRRGHALQSI